MDIKTGEFCLWLSSGKTIWSFHSTQWKSLGLMISHSEEDSHIHPHSKQNEEKGDIPRQKITIGVSHVTFQLLLVTHRGCREHKHPLCTPRSSRAGWDLGSAPKQLGHLPSPLTECRGENEGPNHRITLRIKVQGLRVALAHVKGLTHVTVLWCLSIETKGFNNFSAHLVTWIKVWSESGLECW